MRLAELRGVRAQDFARGEISGQARPFSSQIQDSTIEVCVSVFATGCHRYPRWAHDRGKTARNHTTLHRNQEADMRVEETRAEFQRLVNQRPFQRFIINLENGDRFTVDHPENIAFDPTENGQTRFYLITGSLSCFGTLQSVTSVVLQDIGEAVS
jgi:hypothetical protein